MKRKIHKVIPTNTNFNFGLNFDKEKIVEGKQKVYKYNWTKL